MSGETREYVICTPGHAANAGIRALHILRKELQKRGFRARIYNWLRHKDGSPTDLTATEITDDLRENGIVVYPEIIRGNPLGFRHVVRWVLNSPGKLGGDQSFHASEMVFAWHVRYLAGVPLLRPDAVDHSLFYDNPAQKRDRICTFVHKRGKFRSIPEDETAVQITMKWPERREDLAALLRRTSCLYSYDDNSSILEEALACGAQVKIVTETGYADYVRVDVHSPEAFARQMEHFIRITQGTEHPAVNRRGYYGRLSLWELVTLRRLARIARSVFRLQCLDDQIILLKQGYDFVPRRIK